MARHNRAAAFYAAANSRQHFSRWSDASADPNNVDAVAHRARQLAAAWRPALSSRSEFLVERASGRNVLDIGCVAHDEARMKSPEWLHRQIADAADRCVGVDILEAGVKAMVEQGFDAVVRDLTTGLGPLAQRGPFDVITAGELIEHVADLDMLFAIAEEGLSADGEMILSTPNPYAPARVRAGQRGIVWENVDHVSYAFPSGIAELAERRGLILSEACTTTPAGRGGSLVQRIKRRLRGSFWQATGFAREKEGQIEPVSIEPVSIEPSRLSRLVDRLRPAPSFVGETFVYVIRRRPDDAGR